MKKHDKIISIVPEGHGQKRVTVEYRGRQISAHYTNMPTVDLFNSKEKGWKKAGAEIYDSVVYNNYGDHANQ